MSGSTGSARCYVRPPLKFTCSDIVQNISLDGVKIPVQQE